MKFWKNKLKLKSFTPQANDSLKIEHEVVMKWVDDAVKSKGKYSWYEKSDLKSQASGKIIFNAKPKEARRFAMAALLQVQHWDNEVERVQSQAKSESERNNPHLLPGWEGVASLRGETSVVISSLMRRSLPLEGEDFIQLISWCCTADNLSTYRYPVGYICRAIVRYHDKNDITIKLKQAIDQFSVKLRASYDKDAKKLATTLEQISNDNHSEDQPNISTSQNFKPIQRVAMGNPGILFQLKRYHRLLDDDEIATVVIGADQFSLREDSPLKAEHALLTELFKKVVGTSGYHEPTLRSLDVGRSILAMAADKRGLVLLAAAERAVNAILSSSLSLDDSAGWQSQYAAIGTVNAILAEKVDFDRQLIFDFLLFFSTRPTYARAADSPKTITDWVEEKISGSALEEGERYILNIFRASIIGGPPLGSPSEDVKRLTQMIGDGARFFLVPGETWSDNFNADLGKLTVQEQRGCSKLLHHFLSSKGARPSGKWINTVKKCIEDVGVDKIKALVIRIFELVDKGQSIPLLGAYIHDTRGMGDTINEENALCLRGFLWIVPLLDPQVDLIRLVGAVAISAYRKVPGVGPRAVKVGNGAIYTLSEIPGMDSVGQLAMLQAKVKFGTAQKMIEKAFMIAAEREGMTRDEIDELAVPEYGLTEVGKRIEVLGDFTAELVTDGLNTELRWIKSDGKSQKSVPKAVKDGYSDELKELKAAGKDIQSMLAAQKERLDQLFLKRKSWCYSIWCERYLNHALIGILVRRLLWDIDNKGSPKTVIWHKGVLVDLNGEMVEVDNDDAVVTLWHPFGKSTKNIKACRQFLEKNKIRQPFKQGHREIYLLTEAEQNTGVYSNRFASHIIKQHQFNALCGQRGWKNTLQLMVDDSFPPAHKFIPEYNIRAEFWISGIGENYGVDTNETGTYWRMATDQVRFYQIDQPLGEGGAFYGQNYGHESAVPLRLQDVPSVVFSEVMRDADLFVGVCSVGNDPAWADGGPEGLYRDYWHARLLAWLFFW